MERVASAIGKIPPQNLEAEQSTLGSMMIELIALEKGIEILCADDFYRPAHEEIFDALHHLASNKEPCDLITLQEELRNRGKLEDCGGTDYLMALVDTVPTAANIEYYAKIVEQKSILRKLISLGTRIAGYGYSESEDDVFDLIEQAEQDVFKLTQKRGGIDIVRFGDALTQAYEKLDTIDTDYGVPIGLKPLARQCIGMANGELILIGGRTGSGKSALVMDTLIDASLLGLKTQNKAVSAGIITNEMTQDQLAYREMAKRSGVKLSVMLRGNLHEAQYDQIIKAVSSIYELPIYLVSAPGWNINKIYAAARRLVAVHKVKIIAIDHMHRIAATNPNAPSLRQLTDIVVMAKDMAVSLNIPILLLAQLNRDIEKRGGDARPQLSDFRECGAIEENADLAWLLWRKKYSDNEPRPEVTEAEIHIAKGRMLGTGIAKVGFNGRMFKFVDVAEEQEEPWGRG